MVRQPGLQCGLSRALEASIEVRTRKRSEQAAPMYWAWLKYYSVCLDLWTNFLAVKSTGVMGKPYILCPVEHKPRNRNSVTILWSRHIYSVRWPTPL